MGRVIADRDGVEGPPGEIEGLGLLDVATTLGSSKTLQHVRGESICDGAPFHGYEMHVGETKGEDCARPVLCFDDGRSDGASSRDGLAQGVYVHGLFADDRQRSALLRALGGAPSSLRYENSIEDTLDALADHCARHIDLDSIVGPRQMTPKLQPYARDDGGSFEPIVHGGRLDQARRLFPNAPQPWIDLSTGVNAHAFPLPEIAPQAWTQLPDAGVAGKSRADCGSRLSRSCACSRRRRRWLAVFHPMASASRARRARRDTRLLLRGARRALARERGGGRGGCDT